MSDWQVSLVFQEGSSNKFWRARALGTVLEVNWGRVGTAGQSQSKVYDSPQDCLDELNKQAAAKRKKGYEDSGDAPAAPTATAPASLPTDKGGPGGVAEPSAAPALAARLALTLGDRRIELHLSVEGNHLRTVALEQHADPEAAAAAFANLRAALQAEGYQLL